MAESGVADHQGLRFRLRDGAQVVTVTLAALYVIGFIVANAYLARYEIVRFDLVRGRYVSAGLLCVFVAVIAASIGWPIGVEYRSGDGRGKSKKARQITALELCVVAVVACNDEIVPLQERIEAVLDDSDRANDYETERNLHYVACTRARDHLLVSGVGPASVFLRDFIGDGLAGPRQMTQ